MVSDARPQLHDRLRVSFPVCFVSSFWRGELAAFTFTFTFGLERRRTGFIRTEVCRLVHGCWRVEVMPLRFLSHEAGIEF